MVNIDVKEYFVVSSDVGPEKGILEYDANICVLHGLAQGGVDISKIPRSTRKHINNLKWVTEEEVDLLKKRGITVTITNLEEEKRRCGY